MKMEVRESGTWMTVGVEMGEVQKKLVNGKTRIKWSEEQREKLRVMMKMEEALKEFGEALKWALSGENGIVGVTAVGYVLEEASERLRNLRGWAGVESGVLDWNAGEERVRGGDETKGLAQLAGALERVGEQCEGRLRRAALVVKECAEKVRVLEGESRLLVKSEMNVKRAWFKAGRVGNLLSEKRVGRVRGLVILRRAERRLAELENGGDEWGHEGAVRLRRLMQEQFGT